MVTAEREGIENLVPFKATFSKNQFALDISNQLPTNSNFFHLGFRHEKV
jgi:hypothetical protein